MDLQTIILAMSIPSAITAFCFWLLEKNITKRDALAEEKRRKRQAEHDEQERCRDELQYIIIQSINATTALSEATAKAIQRIPDAHCNGEMERALDYATKVKHQQKEFITKQGIKNIFETD